MEPCAPFVPIDQTPRLARLAEWSSSRSKRWGRFGFPPNGEQGLAARAVVALVSRRAAALPTTHFDGVAKPLPRRDAARYLAVALGPPLPISDRDAAVCFVGGRDDDLAEAGQGYPVGEDGF